MSRQCTDLIFSESLNFTTENYRLLANGSKKTAILLGYQAYQLDEKVNITVDCAQIGVLADVTEVRHVQLSDLGLLDAVNDGFNSTKALRRELEQRYQRFISGYEVITMVRLDNVEFGVIVRAKAITGKPHD